MSSIRLKDVAAEAGVSLATASLALRGVSSVKESTRAKVVATAQKLGYRPDAAAAILASRRERTSHRTVSMAWLTAHSPEWKQRFPLETDSAVLAAAEADRLGLRFEHCNAERKADVVPIIHELDARGCNGIVLDFRIFLDVPPALWNRFAVVSTMEDQLREGVDVVCSNPFRSTIGLLRRIRQAGYKRIGICLRDHTPFIFADEMRHGAASTFQTYDLSRTERIPLLRIPVESSDTGGRLAAWVEKNRPDVVMGSSEYEMTLLEKQGFRISDDFAYAALHVEKRNLGSLAGRQYNPEVVSAYAVQMLMEKMRSGLCGLSAHPREVGVVPPILAGTSCPGLEGDTV